MKYQFFPRSQGVSPDIQAVIGCFEKNAAAIASDTNNLDSNSVLAILRDSLQEINFRVESGKADVCKIHVPVLFGENNRIDKEFNRRHQ
jgi:hypothetical protein